MSETQAASTRKLKIARTTSAPQSTQDRGPLPTLCDETTAKRRYIYALIDPVRPARIRYVGRCLNYISRYQQHIVCGAPAVARWVKDLALLGGVPAMVLIEVCSARSAKLREAHWINHYSDMGMADLNTSREFIYRMRAREMEERRQERKAAKCAI